MHRSLQVLLLSAVATSHQADQDPEEDQDRQALIEEEQRRQEEGQRAERERRDQREVQAFEDARIQAARTGSFNAPHQAVVASAQQAGRLNQNDHVNLRFNGAGNIAVPKAVQAVPIGHFDVRNQRRDQGPRQQAPAPQPEVITDPTDHCQVWDILWTDPDRHGVPQKDQPGSRRPGTYSSEPSIDVAAVAI